MAITFQSLSTAVAGTTSAALNLPASVAAGDLLIGHLVAKPFGSVPTWTNFAPVATIASGAVAAGSGVGSVNGAHALRCADSALSGTETVAVATGSPTLGAISRWSVAAGKVWNVQHSQAADTVVTGTTVSATGGTLQVVPGDVIVITVATTDELAIHTLGTRALAIAGATLSAITWSTDITTATGNDAALMVGRCTVNAGSVTAAPVYTATGAVSGQSAAAVCFMRLREQDPQLPGLAMGSFGDPMVEPESHSHNPPVVDGNGNLYRHGESNINHDTNRMLVHKSTDGGITWKSVDWANHPTAQDLECTWVQKVGTKFYVLITRDDTVWLVPFNMSDDASPDTYGTQETVDSALSSTGVVQYCSFVVLSNGNMRMFYSDLLSGANNQIGMRTRTAVNTYSAKSTFNDGAVDVTGPAAVLGANDVTYVFYHDKTGNTLYYRTVSAAGVISARTSIASAANVNSQSMPHTNPIYYDDNGVEKIGIAFMNDSDILMYTELWNGVQQGLETVSTAALTRNPGTTDSQAAVANLAVDPLTKRIYAMWSRAADGDLLRDTRIPGTGWGTDVVVWASAGQTGWYVYCDVAERNDWATLVYTYDQGIHVDDGSNITYNEVPLYPLSGPQVVEVQETSWTGSGTPLATTHAGAKAGDKILVVAFGDGGLSGNAVTAATTTTTAGTTGAWAEIEEELPAGGQRGWLHSAIVDVTADGSVTTSTTRAQTGTARAWGRFSILLRNAGAVGNHAKTTSGGAEDISLSVSQDSLVVVGSYDYDGVTVATGFTPAAGANEIERTTDATNGTRAAAYWQAQAAGTRAYGTNGTSASPNINMLAIEILAAGGGGPVAVAQSTETDTATALVEKKLKTVAQGSTLNSATALVQRKTRIVGQALTTSTATALGERKLRAVGQATELDTAAAAARRKTRIVGQASESDTAAAVALISGHTMGQAAEVDTATTLARAKALGVVRAVEGDTGRSVTPVKLRAVGRATEADAATALAEAKRRALAQASESDAATQVVRRKLRAVGQATELDTGGGIQRPGQVGRAFALDTATALTEAKRKTLSQATELDTGGGAWTRRKTRLVAQAVELATATALFRQKLRALLRATEADTGTVVAERKGKAIGGAAEVDTARATAGGGQVAILGQAQEIETALPITYRFVTPRPAGDVTVVPDLGMTPRPSGVTTPQP